MALNLHKTVEELKHTMSQNEFIEWQEYYNEEPFLADRLEGQLAKIGYTNLFTGMSKPEIEFDYFLRKKIDKNVNSKQDKLENDIKRIFGVKE